MFTVHWWRTRIARRKGAIDGRREIPAVEQEQAAYYEQILCDRGRQRVHRLWGRHCRRVERLEAKADSLFQRFRTTTENFAQEHLRYLRRRTELGRDVMIYVRRSWYLILLAFIMFGEWILNSQAFEVFQKPTWMTWLMALVVALGLPLSAHFVGIWVRQWPKPAWKTAIKVTIAVGLVVGGLYGINIARREYVLAMDVGESQIIAEAFFLINIMVYVAAVLLSYFSHDPDQELENLRSHSHRLAGQSGRLDHALGRVLSQLDDRTARWRATLAGQWGKTKELIHAYRDANLGYRKDAVRPLSFEMDPEDPVFVREERQRAPTIDEVSTVRERRNQALRGIGTIAGEAAAVGFGAAAGGLAGVDAPGWPVGGGIAGGVGVKGAAGGATGAKAGAAGVFDGPPGPGSGND